MKRPDEATLAFEAQRPRLLRLAYRMLGSMAEAEDVVQDAWLRWQQVDRPIEVPAAYLTRIVSGLCLDRMKSARARRETYVGAWLPEPLVGTTEDEGEDDLTLTLMMALERDAGAVRQLAVRARKHVQAARPRYPVDEVEAERIARAFFEATREGDTQALSAMLAKNVVLQSDGGGKVLAFRNPIVGIARVLRLYAGLRRKSLNQPAQLIRPMVIDGLPGFVSLDRGEVLQTTALAVEDGLVTEIYIVRNPDKLRHVARLVNGSGQLAAG